MSQTDLIRLFSPMDRLAQGKRLRCLALIGTTPALERRTRSDLLTQTLMSSTRTERGLGLYPEQSSKFFKLSRSCARWQDRRAITVDMKIPPL